MTQKAEWDDFRDWLETNFGTRLLGRFSVPEEHEDSAVQIAGEAGFDITDSYEHENGVTITIEESRHNA